MTPCWRVGGRRRALAALAASPTFRLARPAEDRAPAQYYDLSSNLFAAFLDETAAFVLCSATCWPSPPGPSWPQLTPPRSTGCSVAGVQQGSRSRDRHRMGRLCIRAAARFIRSVTYRYGQQRLARRQMPRPAGHRVEIDIATTATSTGSMTQ